MRNLSVIFCILIFSIPALVNAGIYRWVDKNGQVHYGSVPPKMQKEYRPGFDDELSDNNKNGNKDSGEIVDKKLKNASGRKLGTANKSKLKQPVAGNNTLKKQKSTINRERDIQNDISRTNQKLKNVIKDSATKKIDKKTVYSKEKKPDFVNGTNENKKLSKKNNSHTNQEMNFGNRTDSGESKKLDEQIKRLHEPGNHSIKNPLNTRSETKLNNKIKAKSKGANRSTKKNKQIGKKIELKNSKYKNVKERKESSERKFNKLNHSNSSKNEDINKLAPISKAEEDKEEKCGFFSGYVDTYQYRIKYECPGEHCDLLKQQLEKFKKKKASYCDK